MKRWIGRLGLGFTLGLALMGCAQEREPINRVQANAMKKSYFVGEDLASTADDPEFYKRDTVVDVGYGAAQDGLFTSTYAQPVSRIRWEITEGLLNARLGYERVQGSDGKGNKFEGNKAKFSNDGQIVASYRISSHFDIRRSYNPSTGEELNVIEENGSDRPWYEREYFRVDWSTNLVTDAYDFDTLSMMGIYGGISYEPLSYTVNDPGTAENPNPDAPLFAEDYFDITNKAFARPNTLDLSYLGWGIKEFPACFLPGEFSGGTQPYGNCNPTEITIRSAYKKVVDTDYEPKNDDGYRFQAAGAFSTEYRGYERNYGMLDNQWYRFLSRYNLWARSHYYDNAQEMTGAVACATYDTTEKPTGSPTTDPNRDLDKNGTADECEAVTTKTGAAGSQCDIFTKKCTLPYAKREVKPIAWYVTGTTDEDWYDASNRATEEWDTALKAAVQTARLVECRRTGKANCENQFPMWSGQQEDNAIAMEVERELNLCRRKNGWDNASCNDAAKATVAKHAQARGNANDKATLAIGDVVTLDPVITLCHNPVIDSDHPACGSVGTSPRLGDLRYNQVTHIAKPQTPSAWGIMVDADDPLTGEKVAASINVWTHVTDIAAQQLVDLVRYVNGELTTAEVSDGKYILNWAAASKLTGGNMGPTMTKEEVDARVAAASGMDYETFSKSIVGKQLPSQLKKAAADMKARVADIAVDSTMASPAHAKFNASLAQLRGTPIETELMNKPMLQAAGISGSMPLSGPIADIASPLALNNPRIRSQMQRMKENALAERGACLLNEAPEASSLPALAEALKAKFPISENETASASHARHQEMFRYIRRMYHYAVIGHEMGHSVGLRHNFVSTTGPMHFRPEYWQLRTKNGTVDTLCETAASDGSSCVGPRYYDPITPEESSQLMEMFQHSTVMDYPGDLSQDMIGLGAYDFHAARMFYGDVATVFSGDQFKAGTPLGVGVASATDTFGGLAGIQYSVGKDNQGKLSPTTFHYSALQKEYKLIGDCYDVTPAPNGAYEASKEGKWHPVLDGHFVTVDGQTKKCRTQPVDYVAWQDLRMPSEVETGSGYYRGGPSIDTTGRSRVPYHFATDRWADTGNASVFRHDGGADVYEQMQFLISVSEARHVFDNYRRGRSTFDVKAAEGRYFSRYNEKILGVSSGMSFISSIYQELATNYGYAGDQFASFIMNENYKDNVLAGTIAFDHFAKVLSRPQPGDHYIPTIKKDLGGSTVLRSMDDGDDFDANDPENAAVTIPNGVTGYSGGVSYGGRPLNNAYAEGMGEFNTDYTIGAGSYYSKANVMMLLAESEDRYVSSSRRDFYDARFRANGIPDLFSDGFRRLLANALTNDRALLAPHVKTIVKDKPDTDPTIDPKDGTGAGLYPSAPMMWTSWWPKKGPKLCSPSNGQTLCYGPDGSGFDFNNSPIGSNKSMPVDPQIGWEVQKFLITYALAGVRDTSTTWWLDQMEIFKAGPNDSPQSFSTGRIEWQDPQSGQVFYAKRFGKECLFGDTANNCAGGKLVEKGIGARVLEFANSLTSGGYKLDTVNYPATGEWPAGFNEFGRAMVLNHPNGSPIVKADPAISDLDLDTGLLVTVKDCDQNLNSSCVPVTLEKNHYAVALKKYKSVPDFIRMVGGRMGYFNDPHHIGWWLDA